MTIASDHHFPRHSHDGFGIGVLSFGAQRSWSGIGAVEAGPGDVIMVNPGEIHDGMPFDGGVRGWRMLYLDPALMAAELADETAAEIEIVRPVARDPRLAGAFHHAFARLTEPGAEPLAREEALVGTLAHLLRRHIVKPPRGPEPSPGVARARKRLDEAPELPASLAELAALSGTTRFGLLRGFVREVGITPHAYLVQARVRLARRLIARGLPPAEAALASGFCDQSHLTRAFVRQFGITPGRYRAALG
ncbi:AraC family transcriptional regulator [Salinarimonas soli]|uniref:AraC family transcriptional regulator n=2 Tax=Salinarimonas soli TaxID=1638099 RepID=A0A5B2V8Y1_9HYPH|nr:AraC family transcriptional regulator [Salinarimonas soli]